MARSPWTRQGSSSPTTTRSFFRAGWHKWSDGSELSADDVVFTFELGKTASVRYSTVWQYVDSVTAKDPRTVEFKLKSKPYNPIFVKNFIAYTFIVPKAVFGSIDPEKIPTEPNMKPVGSGPSCWTRPTRPRST